MRKRIFAIIGSCLVLGAMIVALAVPAFAVSNSNGTQYYSPLRIDTIEIGENGIRDTWLFNEIQSGTERYESTFGNYLFEASWLQNYARFDFWYDDVQSFDVPKIALRSSTPQIVSVSDLAGVYFGFGTSSVMDVQVIITFDLWYDEVSADGNSYILREFSTGASWRGDARSIPIGNLIAGSVESASGTDVAMISNLSIVIIANNSQDFLYGLSWMWDGVTHSTSPSVWFAGLNLSLEINVENASYFDVTEWLARATGAFLRFEFAPGFSIDMIFGVLAVIAVVLLIITLVV